MDNALIPDQQFRGITNVSTPVGLAIIAVLIFPLYALFFGYAYNARQEYLPVAAYSARTAVKASYQNPFDSYGPLNNEILNNVLGESTTGRMIHPTPTMSAQKLQIISDAKTILGCDYLTTCRQFCDQTQNRDKCDQFGKMESSKLGTAPSAPSSLGVPNCADPSNKGKCFGLGVMCANLCTLYPNLCVKSTPMPRPSRPPLTPRVFPTGVKISPTLETPPAQ